MREAKSGPGGTGHLMKHAVFIFSILISVVSFARAETYSKLWGKNGELWTEEAKNHLLDFTNAGYKNGDVLLPDWPVGVTVTDFGAIPNDDIDDSAAFNAAIAACPEYNAVYVPNGTWILEGQVIASKDNIVVRGEDMYGTIIYMPQYTSVLPDADQFTAWYMLKGNNSGLENFTFKLTDQQKVSHWDGLKGGAHPIVVSAENSWVRNVYIFNGDNALTIDGGSHNTVVNVILDSYLGRASEGGYVGHLGIAMRDTKFNLVHNVTIYGRWHHALCTLGKADDHVWSQARMENGEIDHHSAGGRRQLYADIDAGEGWILFEQDMSVHKPETYWNLKSEHKDWPYGTNRDEIRTNDVAITIVAMQTSDPSDARLTNEYWYETIDPNDIYPQNIYLAQMSRAGKPLPDYPMPDPPEAASDEPVTLTPVADCMVQGGGSRDKNYGRGKLIVKLANEKATRESYLKFDLSDATISSIGSAKLRVYLDKAGLDLIAAQRVEDDSWDEFTLTWNTKPDAGPDIASIPMQSPGSWYELDVTEYAQQEFKGDKQLSIKLVAPDKGGYAVIKNREAGSGPQLIIQASDSIDADISNDNGSEPIAPDNISPQKTELAQVSKAEKPRPDDPMPEPSETSSAGSITLSPVADSMVQGGGSSDKNYGRGKLIVKYANNEKATRESYLKFDLSDAAISNIRSVKLRVYLEKAGLDLIAAQEVEDDSWDEYALTWSTKPAAGLEIASIPMKSPGTWYEFDVTEYTKREFAGNKLMSIKLVSPSGGGYAVIRGRESEDGPQLIIEPLSH